MLKHRKETVAERIISTDIQPYPEQQTRGSPLEGFRYTSREFFEQEWQGMWTKVWLLLGRESELPEPGDWQMEPVGREEILMVRQTDGTVKAFHNVCQHRGNPLVEENKGHVKRFVCRYHSWAYLPDGELNFAPDGEDFPEGNPCGKLRLQEIACETFAGFVWVNMNPDGSSLKSYLGPIWDEWQAREVHAWTRTMANSMWLPCNWKVVMDNFNESYHVPTVHMGATTDTDRTKLNSHINTYFKETRFDLSDEGHNRMIMEGGYGVGSTDREGNILDPLAGTLRFWDLDPEAFKGRPEDTRGAIQSAKRRLGAERGFSHYDRIPNQQLTDAFHYTLFPNFAVSLWSDGFHFLRARPHPTDPEQCLFDNWWYSSPAAMQSGQERGLGGGDHEVEVTMLEFGSGVSIGPGIEDDVRVFVTQQRGFRSRGFKGVYLAEQEARIRRYHELIDDYIEGRLPH